MTEMKFQHYNLPSRKSLLDAVKESLRVDVLEKFRENSEAWLEELNTLNEIFTRRPLCAGLNAHPPEDERQLRNIGENYFFHDGTDRNEGLWKREDHDEKMKELTGQDCEWTHYRFKTRAHIKVNEDFGEMPPETFVPERFEENAEKVPGKMGDTKRPIFRFELPSSGGRKMVYAKGADLSPSFFYPGHGPNYRLTSLAGIVKTSSKKEMKMSLDLAKAGINVPRIVATYESPFEEFLFVEEIRGEEPDKHFKSHREELIDQDARMLASMCRAGYRKKGFTDFDDKVFDGKNLWLIDVDECHDLYFPHSINFRDLLLDPTYPAGLGDFKEMQRDIFRTSLRDAIFEYQDSLTPTSQDREAYARAFYSALEWRIPKGHPLKELTSFPEDYMTFSREMAQMCEE